jgi:NAD+ synthase (glutamine-hydrolysing)
VVPPSDDIGFDRTVERCPFVPSDESRLQQDCYEAYNIQVAGLVQRLRATGSQRVVIGVSGGLDSTHALIVTAKRWICSVVRGPTFWLIRCPVSPPAPKV